MTASGPYDAVIIGGGKGGKTLAMHWPGGQSALIEPTP